MYGPYIYTLSPHLTKFTASIRKTIGDREITAVYCKNNTEKLWTGVTLYNKLLTGMTLHNKLYVWHDPA
jgi:hypothetical protein